MKNFRSIENIEFSLRNYTSLIGANNAGKSTIFSAIDYFLNQVKPQFSDWRNNNYDEPIIIECLFENLQGWESTCPGVAGIVQNNEIHLRLVASADVENSSIKVDYEAHLREEQIDGWSSGWRDLSQTIKDIAVEQGITGTSWRTVSNRESIKQYLRENHADLITIGDYIWTDEGISIKQALQQALPKCVVIPAVSKISDDLKTTGKSPFNQLLSSVVMPVISRSDEFRTLQTAIQALTEKMQGQAEDEFEEIRGITDSLTTRLSGILDAEVLMSLSTPDSEKFINSGATLLVNDGHTTSPDNQGNGAQRALTFALLETIARMESAQAGEQVKSTLLLFEEPELYIHPHLMRKLKGILETIGASNNWQVVSTTHSPFLIDVASDPKSLVLVSRNGRGEPSEVKQLQSDPFAVAANGAQERQALRAALDFHPTVCEAFFASRVVLVEGDSEVAVFKRASEILEVFEMASSNVENTTIVSCGGKWTIPAIARLLANFEIPFRIVHDMDRKDRTEEELQNLTGIDPYRANAKIDSAAPNVDKFVVEDTLEDLLWPNDRPAGKDKPYQAWKRIDYLLENVDELRDLTSFRDLISFVYEQ
ncbi:ATP-dependent nuclease [Photobacterium angustum]|uniref:ATP-dependent nuclease n=1 Tax=Photobacterium angustum TaxID=661 RepID=UPI0009BC4393|nr:AAA family ATPase [Photobacterium angustum]